MTDRFLEIDDCTTDTFSRDGLKAILHASSGNDRYVPPQTLYLARSQIPKIPEGSEATKRRLRVVPFVSKFLPDETLITAG